MFQMIKNFLLSKHTTYTIVLESVGSNPELVKSILVAGTVLELEEVEYLLKKPPSVIVLTHSKSTADLFVHKLEGAGATVSLSMHVS